MGKDFRSKVVRESLLDYDTLANSLKENTDVAVRSLLDEAVRDTYAKLLSEDDDKDYSEDEVDDTNSDAADDSLDDSAEDAASGSTEDDVDDTEADDADTEMEQEPIDDADASGETTLPSEDGAETEDAEASDGDGDGDDEWAEFDKYKVSDDEYDFSNAEDDEIVKVYKLMKNDDQIFVHKDEDNKVNIQDNETGAEYLIDLGGYDSAQTSDTFGDESADDFGAEEEYNEDMNESTERMFELVLEYNSNVGYTDNYQGKDVMTNPGMSDLEKNVNDWDKGVPHGTEKPWSKKSKKADKPFDAASGKKVEEETDVEGADGEEQVNELKTNAEHTANVGSTSRTDGPNNPRRRKGRNFHTAQGGQESGTADNPYKGGVAESLVKRVNNALKENKELKSTLTDVMKSLKEAAVTNHNLAQIIKLISENSTSQDEKMEIIKRFSNEARTIDESKKLYESISTDLKKSRKMNITEDKSLTVESSKKVNETPIYKSQDLMESLDLMHRMMK